MINIETGLYALDRIDEAAAELKAKAQGHVVTRAGWEIVDGDKRLAPDDVSGCDLDKIVAHAKSQIAAAKDPRLCGATAQLSAGAKIRFLLATWDQLADCAATVEGSEQIRRHGRDAVRAAPGRVKPGAEAGDINNIPSGFPLRFLAEHCESGDPICLEGRLIGENLSIVDVRLVDSERFMAPRKPDPSPSKS